MRILPDNHQPPLEEPNRAVGFPTPVLVDHGFGNSAFIEMGNVFFRIQGKGEFIKKNPG